MALWPLDNKWAVEFLLPSSENPFADQINCWDRSAVTESIRASQSNTVDFSWSAARVTQAAGKMAFIDRPVVRSLSCFLLTVNSPGFIVTSILLLLAESILCTVIIWKVPYTEIDWSTYMQQVKCYIRGIRNYSLIEGDTGPVVYPAGHIFVYRILSAFTDGGKDIRRGQYIFEAFYLMTLILIFRIYHKSRKIPPFVLVFLCCTSYRIHSIFILRLFNDPIAMLLFYIALNFWLSHQWLTGCVFYSLAVSIKMNVLLFAPAVFFILLLNNGPAKTTLLLAVCGVVQVYMAVPFLLYDPMSYLKRSFDLGRVFLFKWTVNWRFLPEEIFLDKRLHLILLVVHALLLLAFAGKVWFRSHGGLVLLLHNLSRGLRTRIGSNEVLMALFTANLLGICVARSLHYQFYSWYFHSLPYLLFSTIRFEVIPDGSNTAISKQRNPLKDFPIFSVIIRAAILLGIELCWNTYPSTMLSSAMLHLFHLAVIAIVLFNRPPVENNSKNNKNR